jgi:D-glycero-D-manno-heptose 1,7-bisphosphate phosphatase
MIYSPTNKALFIDRDGVINIDKGHVFRQEDFEFTEDIFNICREFADKGFLIIVITNQAGIAKGLYREEDYRKLTDWMVEHLKKNGILISKVYHCPHHPDFTGPCECRKPAPGMILQAIKDFGLNIEACHLIGDSETDLLAGMHAGIPIKNLKLWESPNSRSD